ncbi:MAG: PA14 domain-containing protein [Verrucomicrobia subdivision 3 bacterium]|nr:PA14 domain-containing protein [Limisphaerales bacterium]
MKTILRRFILVSIACAFYPVHAANIVWISDAPAGLGPFFPTNDPAMSDHGWIVLLQNAGHNVIRYNPPDGGANAMPQPDVDALNTNDLVILGRTFGSGAVQVVPQVTQWNSAVTKPVLTINAYLVRANRMGWCVGNTLPDGVPTPVTALDLNDPETAFIFSGVAMNGNTTVEVYDEALDRNTSQIVEGPVTGGTVLAQATFVPLGGTTPTTVNIIMEWPAGTPVRGGADILGSYRIYLAAGSREAAGASVPGTSGRENLTPTGEDMFLKAVDLALNNGIVPSNPTDPVGFRTHPPSLTIDEASYAPASFTAIATGAPPRTLQWQRSDGAGGFTNIPGAISTPYVLAPVRATDSGAMFRAVVNNAFSAATSQVATLTVNADLVAPTVRSVSGTESFLDILVKFSERMEPVTAGNPANYQLNGMASITNVVLSENGSNALVRANFRLAEGTTYMLTVGNMTDSATAANPLAGTTLPVTTFCVQPGYLRREIYSGFGGTLVADLTNHATFKAGTPAGGVSLLDVFETGVNQLDNYGTRVSGYVIPPETGNYTFYLGTDDSSALYLSPDDNPYNKVRIAAENSWGPFRMWTGDRTGGTRGTPPSNISLPIPLEAGQRYYIEMYHKEGTGGDHISVTWQLPSELTAPANGTPSIITNLHIAAINPCAPITITQQPQTQTVPENRYVIFSVAYTTPVSNLATRYQWRKDGVAIPGATGATYTTPLTQLSDSGSMFDVIIVVPGGSNVSSSAELTVIPDTEPPFIVSVGSVDGFSIGVCFHELVDTNAGATAVDFFAYEINGGADIRVTNVVARADQRSVQLQYESLTGTGVPLSGQFVVKGIAIKDIKGNGEGFESSGTNTVFGAAADLGLPMSPGSNFTCDNSSFELVASGTDIWGNADQGYWAYRSVTGDFDVRVRLESLSLPATAGPATIAKGGLIARESTADNSPSVHLLANPLPPGRNLVEAGRRTTLGGTTANWGTNVTALNIPRWLRLTRTGNNFAGYVSVNGADWNVFATGTQTLPQTLLVGMAASAHTNSTLVTTGQFSNFSIIQGAAQPTIGGLNYSSAGGGSFTGSFATEPGVMYRVEYKNTLADVNWQLLTTVVGDGTTKPFNDPAPLPPTRFYRIKIE